MALKVVKRKSTGAWTISGTVEGMRIQKRAQSNNKRLAEEEASALEGRLLREAWHGPRPASRTIGQAMRSYADAVPRRPRTIQRLARLLAVIREDAPLTAIDQDVLTQLRDRLLKPDASPATFAREIAEPLRAMLRYAARQGVVRRAALRAAKALSGTNDLPYASRSRVPDRGSHRAPETTTDLFARDRGARE